LSSRCILNLDSVSSPSARTTVFSIVSAKLLPTVMSFLGFDMFCRTSCI